MNVDRITSCFLLKLRWCGVSVLVIALVTGCGEKLDKVRLEGRATYAETPIAKGTIVLTPIEDTLGPQTGGDIDNGKYLLQERAAPRAGGTYRVEISNIVPSGRTIQVSANPNVAPVEAMENTIPPRYNSQSTLTLTIPSNVSKFHQDFDLPAKNP